jgi:hypothetical protein
VNIPFAGRRAERDVGWLAQRGSVRRASQYCGGTRAGEQEPEGTTEERGQQETKADIARWMKSRGVG